MSTLVPGVRADESAGAPTPGGGRSESASARSRNPRSTLTEAQIVDAALRVIGEDGVDSLSMRRLSRELGVSAMACYYYVANKEELLDLVAKRALAGIQIPTDSGLPWHVRLRVLIERIDAELRHYQGVGEVLLERMRSTDRRIMCGTMEILEEAGFDDDAIVMAYATVHTYLFGRYRVTMSGPPQSKNTEHDDIASRLQPTILKLRGRDYFDFGAGTLVAGLRAQLQVQLEGGVPGEKK